MLKMCYEGKIDPKAICFYLNTILLYCMLQQDNYTKYFPWQHPMVMDSFFFQLPPIDEVVVVGLLYMPEVNKLIKSCNYGIFTQ